VFGCGFDLFDHRPGSHFGAGDDLDGDAVVGGGYLDVGSTDVDYENFHGVDYAPSVAFPNALGEMRDRCVAFSVGLREG
jgi:hypothetical protein